MGGIVGFTFIRLTLARTVSNTDNSQERKSYKVPVPRGRLGSQSHGGHEVSNHLTLFLARVDKDEKNVYCDKVGVQMECSDLVSISWVLFCSSMEISCEIR